MIPVFYHTDKIIVIYCTGSWFHVFNKVIVNATEVLNNEVKVSKSSPSEQKMRLQNALNMFPMFYPYETMN